MVGDQERDEFEVSDRFSDLAFEVVLVALALEVVDASDRDS